MEDDEYSAVPSKATHPKATHPLIVNAEEYPMAQSPPQVTLKAPPLYSASKLLTRSINNNYKLAQLLLN